MSDKVATKSTVVRYTVEMEVDNEAWDLNYAPDNVGDDIRIYMQTIIEEVIKQYIETSGNTATVKVTPR